MMNAAELLDLCEDFRYRGRGTDDEVVARIENDVAEYRIKFHVEPVPQLPPGELLELLPLMGWLLYEASWYSLRRVQAAFEAMEPADRAPSEVAFGHINRLADAARAVVWPEFAARSLGAVRALALAQSKRDTEAGYELAWSVHQEAADLHEVYSDSHGDSPDRERYLLDLDEVLLQLALAETGTACRTAERVIGRWVPQFSDGDVDDLADEERWVQRMYQELTEGVEIGLQALRTARQIRERYGLVHQVDQYRLALVTGSRNPGIMTARAALLALALTPAMEYLNRHPAAPTWKAERARLIGEFTTAYQEMAKPVHNQDGQPVPMVTDHKRALVQLRLNLALLVPGSSLPTPEPFNPCLAREPLDDEAVQQMSAWLAREPSNGGPHHGNVLGAALLPLVIQSVVALRALTGDGDGYARWRIEWFELGRHSNEAGRRKLVDQALAIAASRPPLQISTE
jgi:hypothetical protein